MGARNFFYACECEERDKPVKERAWRVIDRRCNHSAFNGYQETYSDYSSVYCPRCQKVWRTKAEFVFYLRNGTFRSADAAFLRDTEGADMAADRGVAG